MIEKGAYVSLVTPFNEKNEVDWPGFEQNIEFQISQGIKGILFVEVLNGESATLSPQEHCSVLEKGIAIVDQRVFCLAGTGSNALSEALEYTEKAKSFGYQAAVLVAPYCNPVSSYDVRENYYREIARRFCLMSIIPHTIPGRTAVIEPNDILFLEWKNPNICAIIENNSSNQRIERMGELPRPDFGIFSNDDTWACQKITGTRLNGVFSAVANIAPAAVCSMTEAFLKGDLDQTERIKHALSPIMASSIVQERNVFYKRESVTISDEIFNPVIIKTMMTGLGIPAGFCRKPLGYVGQKSLALIRKKLEAVWHNNPWVLKPLEDFYQIDISQRLKDNSFWQ
jgi:4-hydroxy-tetrahydrodipicolinate synthase